MAIAGSGGSTIYAIAAALVARARREINEHFETQNAFSPAQAVAYDPPDHIHQRQFDLVVGRGVVQATGDGRYWLDREALRLELEQRQSALRKVLVIIAIGIVVAIAVGSIVVTTAAHG